VRQQGEPARARCVRWPLPVEPGGSRPPNVRRKGVERSKDKTYRCFTIDECETLVVLPQPFRVGFLARGVKSIMPRWSPKHASSGQVQKREMPSMSLLSLPQATFFLHW
jgi:hypothetical protein